MKDGCGYTKKAKYLVPFTPNERPLIRYCSMRDRLSFFPLLAESALGAGQGTEFLTNDDIMHVLHASNPRLPYVFEKFSKWGVTDDWDFCPECLVDAAIDDEEST